MKKLFTIILFLQFSFFSNILAQNKKNDSLSNFKNIALEDAQLTGNNIDRYSYYLSKYFQQEIDNILFIVDGKKSSYEKFKDLILSKRNNQNIPFNLNIIDSVLSCGDSFNKLIILETRNQ